MSHDRTDRHAHGGEAQSSAPDRVGKPGGRTLTERLPVQRSPLERGASAAPFGPVDAPAVGERREPAADPFGVHLIGQSRPLDPLGQSRPLDPLGQSFADPSRDADGDGRADLFTRPRASAHKPQRSRHAIQLATAIQAAIADADMIPATLLPAYADARDALDPAALQALATDVLTKYQAALDVRDQVKAIVDPNDPGHAAYDVLPATPDSDADRADLGPRLGGLEVALSIVESRLAIELGPTRFRGLEVAGAVAPVRIARHAQLTIPRLLREAINTGELVAAVVEIRDLVPTAMFASAAIDPDTARTIADRLAPYTSRPVHFAFVKAALGSLGLWAQIEHATGSDGRSLAQADQAATAQAARFGSGADLGAYKVDQIVGLLKPRQSGPNETTYTVTESSAAKVIDAVSAIEDPEGRAAALRDLQRLGLLDTIADLGAPAKVGRLHDSLPQGNGHVRSIMRPHFEDRDTEDNSLGTMLGDVPLVGGALHAATNIATFGFLDEHDAAYRAMKSGEITEAEFHQLTGKALLRAGVVGAVSYATGGAAGAYAQGLTGSLAARGVVGRVAANTITGAAAGSAGAIGGRLGSDAVDGRLSSGGDYAHDALMGGAIGGGLGGGLTTVGAAGARYLPETVKTPLHRLAERFPSLADDAEVFAAFQRLGARHSEGVVTFAIGSRRLVQLAADGAITLSAEAWRSVRQFASDTRALGTAARAKASQVFDDFSDGAGPQLAGAGAYGDVRVNVTAQAARPLHVPGPLDGPAVTVLKAERLADDLASHVGDDAADLADDLGGRDAVELMEGNAPRRASFADDDPWDSTADANGLGAAADDAIDPMQHEHVFLDEHKDGVTIRSQSDAQQSGIVPDEGAVYNDQHHAFPDEHREWFADPKNVRQPFDVDDWTLDIEHELHSLMHAGRGIWPGEWNARILIALQRERRVLGRPLAIEDMKVVARRELEAFGVPETPYRRYTGTKDTAARRKALGKPAASRRKK